jgi:hypothetical protein
VCGCCVAVGVGDLVPARDLDLVKWGLLLVWRTLDKLVVPAGDTEERGSFLLIEDAFVVLGYSACFELYGEADYLIAAPFLLPLADSLFFEPLLGLAVLVNAWMTFNCY